MMLRKLLLISLPLCLLANKIIAQDNFYYSQYFQVSHAINPAFTGIDNFTDLMINHRNQWSGFKDSPNTNFIGINSSIKSDKQSSFKEYALRISNPELLDSIVGLSNKFSSKIKHGIGGYIAYDAQVPFEQISGYVNYAIHLPVGYRTRLSIGVSMGILNNRINFEKIDLRDPDNDDFYQQLVAQGGRNTYFDISPGMALYHNSWFLTYAAQNAIRKPLSTDEILSFDEAIDHHFLLGLKINLSEKNRMTPSYYYVRNDQINDYWETNIRMIFQEKPWFGVSYRSTKALVFMAGVFANNLLNISYSYDYVLSNLNNYTNGSHELHLGFMLSKKDLKAPYLW
jgi:type IX secretion system PorP/SprF family membrane protein